MIVVSPSTSCVAVTHALISATIKKLDALEIETLDGAVTVQLVSRELSDGAGGAEKGGRESSYVRDKP